MLKRGFIFLFWLLLSVGLPVLLVHLINGLFWPVFLLLIIFIVLITKGNKFNKNKFPEDLSIQISFAFVGIISLIYAMAFVFFYESMFYKQALKETPLSQISTALVKDKSYFIIQEKTMDLSSTRFDLTEGEHVTEKGNGTSRSTKYYYIDAICRMLPKDSALIPAGVKLWLFGTEYGRTELEPENKFEKYCKEFTGNTFILSERNHINYRKKVDMVDGPGEKNIIIEAVDVEINYNFYYIWFAILFGTYSIFCFIIFLRNLKIPNK